MAQYGLSNISHETLETTLAMSPAFGRLAGVVASGLEGVMKPDPAIYRLTCERFGLAPEEILFIDDSAEARALLRENVAALGLGGVSRIFRRNAVGLGAAHPLPPFSLAFLDPPYGRALAEAALAAARAGGWLTAGALAVVEEAADAAFAAPAGFDELERRRYDDTSLILLRHHG